MICKENQDRKEKIAIQVSVNCRFVGVLQDHSAAFFDEDKWCLDRIDTIKSKTAIQTSLRNCCLARQVAGCADLRFMFLQNTVILDCSTLYRKHKRENKF